MRQLRFLSNPAKSTPLELIKKIRNAIVTAMVLPMANKRTSIPLFKSGHGFIHSKAVSDGVFKGIMLVDTNIKQEYI